jgi:hypothetical protein
MVSVSLSLCTLPYQTGYPRPPSTLSEMGTSTGPSAPIVRRSIWVPKARITPITITPAPNEMARAWETMVWLRFSSLSASACASRLVVALKAGDWGLGGCVGCGHGRAGRAIKSAGFRLFPFCVRFVDRLNG